MTTSTFSRVAMSPPLFRSDMRHVGDAQGLVAVHGAVDDVDRVAAQDEIDEPTGWPLPSLDLVLPHQVDEIVLIDGGERGEPAAAARLARLVDGADGGAVEVHERRLDVELARLQQRLAGRDRHLLVDEMRDTGVLGTGDEGLTQRLDGLGLVRFKET